MSYLLPHKLQILKSKRYIHRLKYYCYTLINTILSFPLAFIINYNSNYYVMQSESLKAILTFLETNNLTDTIAALLSEVERPQFNRKNEKNKSLLSNLSKLKINYDDKHQSSQIRDHLQKTDQNALKRLVHKLNSKLSRTQNQQNQNLGKLKQMNFYKKLLKKQTTKLQQQVRNHRSNALKNEELSIIEVEACNDQSIISRPQEAIFILEENVDQYEDDNDIGYQMYEIESANLKDQASQIAILKDYPRKALLPNSQRYPEEYYKNKLESATKQQSNNLTNHIKLPKHLKFPNFKDDFYPIQYDGTIYDMYNLKIVYDQNKVGFEQSRTLDVTQGKTVAGRYKIINILGQAQFSTAVRVLDVVTNEEFCMKVISNNKDYVDQSLDEIKLLLYININANVDEKCVLKCYDFFYYKEHLIILTQLLKTDLYATYTKFNDPLYFTLKCIQRISKQILIAMEYIHSLHIIHSDLKPENILMKSMSNQLIKVIDFGNGVFLHDKLNFYVQTRSYRAPEIILGCEYDEKIDIWSVGCIVAELFTGRMMFENQSVPSLLAKQQGIVGPWPQWMLLKAKYFSQYFDQNLVIHEKVSSEHNQDVKLNRIIIPKKSNIQARLGVRDPQFVDFIKKLLQIDPTKRLSATEALKHAFLTKKYQD